ncbi:unnamed protein product, partial [Discosporangium mesarthrocarpum]
LELSGLDIHATGPPRQRLSGCTRSLKLEGELRLITRRHEDTVCRDYAAGYCRPIVTGLFRFHGRYAWGQGPWIWLPNKLRRTRGGWTGSAISQPLCPWSCNAIRRTTEDQDASQVRIFLFTSFAASGAVGLFIATTRLVALSQGIDQGQTFSELTTNIAIDISAIFGFLYLVRNDINAQKGRLARMEIGAKLAGLKVRLQLEDDPSTITLAALRRDRGRDKRVAVLAGGLEAVRSSLDSALPYAAALRNSDILIVPLVLEDPTSGGDQGNESPGAEVRTRARLRAVGGENDIVSAVGQAHVALPVALNRWQEYIDTEVDTAFEQGIDPLGDGFSLVLKKNGRIGARSKGCPPWGTLVGDVEKRKAAGMDTTNI